MYTSVYYQPYVQGNGTLPAPDSLLSHGTFLPLIGYVINPSILELTLRNFLVTSTGNPLGVACRYASTEIVAGIVQYSQ